MKAKTKPLRVGMVGRSAFSATLSVENNIAFSGTASPEASFDGYVSHPMEFSGVANSQPVSTLFATDGVFSSLSEAFWGTILSTKRDNVYLVKSIQHTTWRQNDAEETITVVEGCVNIDGGRADSVYNVTQIISGGSA